MKESKVNRIWSLVVGRYRGSVIEAASRGENSLVDGIAALVDGKANLASLLSELPDGEWSLQLRTRRPADAADDWKPEIKTVVITWTAGMPAVVELPDVEPGLRELQVINPRTKRATGPSALVFLCSAERFEKASPEFEAATKLTSTWNEEDRTSSSGPFLRTVLEALAAEK
jgi:hypothetical protein